MVLRHVGWSLWLLPNKAVNLSELREEKCMLAMFESVFGAISQKLAVVFAAISAVATTPVILGVAALTLLFLYVTGYGQRLLVGFYGNFTNAELLKFGLLSIAFFLIIGSYWTLRSIKDPFLDYLVGYKHSWLAKILTMVAMVPLLMTYNKLVDCMSREKLFWVVSTFYATLFVIFGIGYNNVSSSFFSLGHGYIGKALTVLIVLGLAWVVKTIASIAWNMESQGGKIALLASIGGALAYAFYSYGFSSIANGILSSGDNFLAMGRDVTVDGVQLYDLSKLLGWTAYIAVETMGGIIVALFWSYTHSTTRTELGKRGYPLVSIAAQAGNFAGPSLVRQAPLFGLHGLFILSALILMIVPLIINLYKKLVPDDLLQTDGVAGAAKKKTGPGEAFRLMGKHPYLLGLAFVATVYEIVGTLIDFQFKMKASEAFSREALAAYLGQYGQYTATVGILFAILGASFVVRKLGVRWSLLLYPTLLAGIVLMVKFYPVLNILFWSMVCVKMLSYALNNPVKELMYIPTSKDVKFKVKAVIDGFGGKSAKAIGSALNGACSANPAMLVAYGSIASLGIIGVWIMIAIVVGKTYDDLVESKKILD